MYLGFLPFSDWIFVVIIELYELFVYLEIKPLSVTLFANIFSQSIGCIFVLSLIKLYLFLLLFLLPWDPGNLPDPGIKPGSPSLQADTLPSELSG